MKISPEKCIGCGYCVPFCPADAIRLEDKKATIDQDACFECGNCIRAHVVRCPTQAIYEPQENLGGPRAIRRFFSDPATTHNTTGVPGRGTEEVKTNDVTGRVRQGEVGIAVEVGRPNVGTRIAEVEKVCMALAESGIVFEKNNPLTHLMDDVSQGTFKKEYLDEVVLSAIVEFSIPFAQAERTLLTIRETAGALDTVFSLDVICCYDEDGTLPVRALFDRLGMRPRTNAKVNFGLGRPRVM
jgi:NAD-dependent dihydropyrimidine dehydrogenase PreA subunit